MGNVISRGEGELVQSTFKGHHRQVCVIIFIVLNITYVTLPRYINISTKLSAVIFQLFFTSVMAFVGFFAFSVHEHLAPFKSRESCEGVDLSNHAVSKVDDGVGKFCLALKKALNCDLARLILGVAFGVAFLYLTSYIFRDVLDVNPKSSNNQRSLDVYNEPNLIALFLLWTGLSAPIVEELLFRHFLIGVIYSAITECKYVATCRMASLVKGVALSVLVLLSGFSFGLYHELALNGHMMSYATKGVVLGLAYIIGKRNLFSSLLPHCIFNILIVIT